MTRRGYQHFAPPSEVATENRLRFFGHILRRPPDRLVQRVLRVCRTQAGRGLLAEDGSCSEVAKRSAVAATSMVRNRPGADQRFDPSEVNKLEADVSRRIQTQLDLTQRLTPR
ncbi:hypothetical protein RB195_003529 [Necator americanus]|uniref:Uncharacterized protein n=1 Tax=Necator americanus TaxID=51031 RepID=A0ABR1DP04_NECAM